MLLGKGSLPFRLTARFGAAFPVVIIGVIWFDNAATGETPVEWVFFTLLLIWLWFIALVGSFITFEYVYYRLRRRAVLKAMRTDNFATSLATMPMKQLNLIWRTLNMEKTILLNSDVKNESTHDTRQRLIATILANKAGLDKRNTPS